jgi:hypothetical protein
MDFAECFRLLAGRLRDEIVVTSAGNCSELWWEITRDSERVFYLEASASGADDPDFAALNPGYSYASQKSGLSAFGTAASCPGNHWVFSAQTASAQSPGLRP